MFRHTIQRINKTVKLLAHNKLEQTGLRKTALISKITQAKHLNFFNYNHRHFSTLTPELYPLELYQSAADQLLIEARRQLLVHQLPVLDILVERARNIIGKKPFKKTAVVYVHHPLQTSVNVLHSMLSLGVKSENVFVLGKHYSQCDAVVSDIKKLNIFYQPSSRQVGLGKFSQSFIRDINWLWSKVLARLQEDKDGKKEIENVLILDHGGHALSFTPAPIVEEYNVIGIEKTTAGIIHLKEHGGMPPFPIINMANCAAKIFLESPLIAEAVITKLDSLMPIKDKITCGIIGYGAIGKAVTEKLLSMGHKVIVYDNDSQKLEAAKSSSTCCITKELSALIPIADYIFGCTGRDITTSIEYFRLSPKNKTLISCSSEDKEFLSLLQAIQQEKNGKVSANPLNNITYQTDLGATITILRGGFPINFDNSGESVPANDIQLTRALVLGSVLQAVKYFSTPNNSELLGMGGLYAMDPSIQSFIVEEWLKCTKKEFPLELKKNLKKEDNKDNDGDMKWIKNHSSGIYPEPHYTLDLKAYDLKPSSSNDYYDSKPLAPKSSLTC